MFFSAIPVHAQSGKPRDSVNFCFNRFKMPSSCTIEGDHAVRRTDGDFSWMYVSQDNLILASNGLLGKLQTFKDFSKQRISCYILNKKVNGYKVSFKNNGETLYQIIAYGIVNDQPVMIQLVLPKEPVTNADIPDFALQIVRLNK
jgi:hypothetical protein